MNQQTKSLLGQLTYSSYDNSDERLREMILYITARDNSCGATRLNKLIYQADHRAFEESGKPLTGCEYMGLPQGPVPRRLMPVRDALIEAGDLAISEEVVYGRPFHRIVPLRRPDLSLFDPWDIAIVDGVIEESQGKSARQMSDESHGRAWRIAGADKGQMPYQAAFISDDPPNGYDVVRARELVDEYGWDV